MGQQEDVEMASSDAKKLVQLISQAVDDIEVDTASQFPGSKTTNLNLPIVAPEDQLEPNSRRRNATRTLKAATHQLLATLLPAGVHMCDLNYSYLQTVAINVVIRAKIADHIHSIDPHSEKGGVHIEVLAEKAKMDSRKLSHILRFLALRNVFCEATENYWVNNRCSVTLRTDSRNTLCSFLSHNVDDIGVPAIAEFPRLITDHDKDGANSWDPHGSATLKYYNASGIDVFQFLATDQGGYRAERFGKAMIELTRATATDERHYKPFNWSKLGAQGTLLDVGGGIGAAAYPLAKYLPDWTIVIQDRVEVVEKAAAHYKQIGSQAKIEFEVADFFSPQPISRVGNADAYFLRHILHDWPDQTCVQILTHLRRAAKPSARLLLCEACLEPPLLQVDSPILKNGGMGASVDHSLDLSMMSFLNGQERTRKEFKNLFEKSGWKLESVTSMATYLDKCIVEGVVDIEWSG